MPKRVLEWPNRLFIGSNERQATKPTKERAITRLQGEIFANFCLHVQLQLHYVQSLIGMLALHLLFIDVILLLLNPPIDSLAAKWIKSLGRLSCLFLYIISSFVAFYASLRHRVSLYRWHVLLLCASAFLMSLHWAVFGATAMMQANLAGQWIFDRIHLRRYLYGGPRWSYERYRFPQFNLIIDSIQLRFQCCGFEGPQDWMEIKKETFSVIRNLSNEATNLLNEATIESSSVFNKLFISPSTNVVTNQLISNTEIMPARRLMVQQTMKHLLALDRSWTGTALPDSCCAEKPNRTRCMAKQALIGCKKRFNLYNPKLVWLVMSWLCLAYVISALALPSAVYVLRRYERLLATDRKGQSKPFRSKNKL